MSGAPTEYLVNALDDRIWNLTPIDTTEEAHRAATAVLHELARPLRREALAAWLVEAGVLVVNSVGFSGKVKSYRLADTQAADRG